MAYITVQQCRDEGITVSLASDETLTSRIAAAQKWLDGQTGLWFEQRSFTSSTPFRAEGNNMYELFLPVPIITLTSIWIGTTEYTGDNLTNYFTVYNNCGSGFPDDRQMPRIVRNTALWPMATAGGALNIKLIGTFGYVDATTVNGSTTYAAPSDIQRVMILLVARDLTPLGNYQVRFDDMRQRFAKSLRVDSYSTTFGDGMMACALTGDKDIDDIVYKYRSMRIGAY